MTDVIKDSMGRKVGTVDTDSQGNVIVKDFYGRVVSRYTKASNQTRDFFGRLMGFGNVAVVALFKDISK